MSVNRNKNWEKWGDQKYADVMYRRAIGDLPEMESSKALARRVGSVWTTGNSILDVGCGAGHYLRSLRREIGSEFDYTGVDITPHHLALAKKAFAADARAYFQHANLFDLNFRDKSFDIAICTNLMQNLPNIVRPLGELSRVSRKSWSSACYVGTGRFSFATFTRMSRNWMPRANLTRLITTTFIRAPILTASFPNCPTFSRIPSKRIGTTASKTSTTPHSRTALELSAPR